MRKQPQACMPQPCRLQPRHGTWLMGGVPSGCTAASLPATADFCTTNLCRPPAPAAGPSHPPPCAPSELGPSALQPQAGDGQGAGIRGCRVVGSSSTAGHAMPLFRNRHACTCHRSRQQVRQHASGLLIVSALQVKPRPCAPAPTCACWQVGMTSMPSSGVPGNSAATSSRCRRGHSASTGREAWMGACTAHRAEQVGGELKAGAGE